MNTAATALTKLTGLTSHQVNAIYWGVEQYSDSEVKIVARTATTITFAGPASVLIECVDDELTTARDNGERGRSLAAGRALAKLVALYPNHTARIHNTEVTS